MGEHQPPPINQLRFDVYKKQHNEEVGAYLQQLRIFAEETGVWDTIRSALATESTLNINHPRLQIKTHQPKDLPVDYLIPEQPIDSSPQGLLVTGYEENFDPKITATDLQVVNPDLIDRSLTSWLFHYSLFNHPHYLHQLRQTATRRFKAPKKESNIIFESAEAEKRVLTIHDLILSIGAATNKRASRTKVFGNGLTVSYRHPGKNGLPEGRAQARNVFVIGENPDVTGSAFMLATMAANHFLAGIPRDGLFKDPARQAALAEQAINQLKSYATLSGQSSEEQMMQLDWSIHNLIGVIESEPGTAIKRAKLLYEAGIRTFRVYSPEPNTGLTQTVTSLRRYASAHHWQPIEVFAGQVISVDQAVELEQAGANALYLGVAGGGRCITGEVADLAVDWPQLLWKLRGMVGIPVIVQGGANDNPVTTLALGASGIGMVGKLAGTIESPGGTLYFVDPTTERFFKYYGGEASNRTRAAAGRWDILGRTINTEGETTLRFLIAAIEQGIYPSAPQVITSYLEALATGLVFQNARTISDIQANTNSQLRLESTWGTYVRHTH